MKDISARMHKNKPDLKIIGIKKMFCSSLHGTDAEWFFKTGDYSDTFPKGCSGRENCNPRKILVKFLLIITKYKQ